ncbi:MAG: phosphatase PAP2 family protein [Hymenobacteraceae bacterium]|nr:phosphatase PAP2 family protein [Hymenobacteraceae bacterium]MDX5397821.1 phosphatase PAP2 family protein [Hymenobacteraceae bacterium]MDX5443913.1 phosphatase PAP2 family protein [Hymenobacteraceae bacterium]MDX5513900.1 phosphatase PAP2 family protein [Hymenobacteraceae bacterium]
MADWIEKLDQLDRNLLLKLNAQHSPFWDPVMVTVSEKWFWVPFYVLIAAYLVYKFRWQSLPLLLTIGVMVASTDLIASAFFKPTIGRFRPCHDPVIGELVRVIDGCGGKYGFMSSHASNTFGLATFLTCVLPRSLRWFKVLLFVWAIVVTYSRIYLGVHYPGDLLTGGLLGIILGFLYYRLVLWVQNKYLPEKNLKVL